MGGRNFSFAVGLVLVLTMILSCAGSYSPQDRLKDEVQKFNDAVRWGRYFAAAECVQEESRESWLTLHREWGTDLRIADYEVIDSTIENNRETALVRVVVSWYRLTQNVLQTTMLAQRWQLKNRKWILTSEEVEEGAPL